MTPTTAPKPRKPYTRRLDDLTPTGQRDRLTRWDHCLPGMGLECNALLVTFEAGPLRKSTIRKNHGDQRLGKLIFPHKLAELIQPGDDPLYAITQKGRDYLTLLRHHGFLPNP